MRILEIREYRGKNIFTHYPAVKITIDLEELADVWTDEVPGFPEKLSCLLPTLDDHHCTRNREGGFLERLREGTMFGHVIEHVSLELQSLLGHKVKYGKTITTERHGVYDVVIEVGVMEAGIEAVRCAMSIIKTIIEEGDCNLQQELQKLTETVDRYGYGLSTSAIFNECIKRDIPVLSLGEGSMLQLGYGIFQKRSQATITGYTSSIGVDIACNKELTKKMLVQTGIPVPEGTLAITEENALEAASIIGGSVVIKPYDCNQGKGVSLNLINKAEIISAFKLAKNYSDKVIVEKFIPGKHYRVLVIGEQVTAVAERLPAYVLGDGVHSIAELVRIINSDYLRGEGHEKPLTKIKIDGSVLLVLAKQKISLDTIPQPGKKIYLRENANLSTGGTAIDVTELANQDVKKLALRAARTVGLDVAGIDIVCKDISKPLDGQGAVIEVNAAPGFRMHLFPGSGQSRDVAHDFVEYLFPPGTLARIPIISITGTNGKTTTTRLIAYITALWGKCVGLTTTGGAYVGNECLIRGDTTGPVSAQAVLRDPRVEVAVLETARGGILRAGLGYDKAQIGVVTNISEDHLGISGIQDLEQLAMVKALVIEALEKGGHAILNADDYWCKEISKRVKENIIFFSINEENILIRRHLATGQKAFFIRKGYIAYASGERWHNILPVKDVAIGMKGLAGFNIANALAAAAACFCVGIPLQIIKQGLKTFGLEKFHNPGRCQFHFIGEVQVILDYGHNAAAFQSVLSVVKKLKSQRVIGVIGVPGDRRDEDISNIGAVAGEFLDYCIIKEDKDLRGRAPGETAGFILKSLKDKGFDSSKVEIILNEVQAVLAALSKSRPGDVVIVFYEELAPLQRLLGDMEKEYERKDLAIKGLPLMEETLSIVQ